MGKLHGGQLEECDNDLCQGRITSLLIYSNVSYISFWKIEIYRYLTGWDRVEYVPYECNIHQN